MTEIILDMKLKEDLKIKLIKGYLDILILRRLLDIPSSGSDIIQFLIRNYGVYLSPGIVYSMLYSLERRRLVRSIPRVKKRIYVITKSGEEFLRIYQNYSDEFIRFAMEFFNSLKFRSRIQRVKSQLPERW